VPGPVEDVALRARAVQFAHGEVVALNGVDLEAPSGEIRALLGPNGAGKSTLLRVLCGLARPSGGDVQVFGRPIAQWSRLDLARRVAYVPQETPSDLACTVEELVLLGRTPHLGGGLAIERPEDREAAESALRKVDAWALRGRLLSEISGGERQRVVVARAIAQGADILLLDEPAAFLDVRHQVAVYELLAHLAHSEGKAVLTAMHDLNLACAYADSVVLLDRGRSVAAGPPRSALTYARVREVYGADVYVGVNEVTGAPYFLPMAGKR